MKGLLHRLAARAAGTTVPLRSDARLPFGGATLGWGETFAMETAPERSGRASPVPVHPTGTAETAAANLQSERWQQEAPAPGPDRSSGPARPTPPESAVPPEPAATAMAASPHRAAAVRARPMLPSGGGESHGPATLPAEAEPTGAWNPSARQPAVVRAGPPSSGPDAPMRSKGDPPLLMPRGSASPGPGSYGAAAAEHVADRPDLPTRGTEEEPPEVHIHIGRIEVTAVQEASPQRPKPKARQVAMSLETYLAGRSQP